MKSSGESPITRDDGWFVGEDQTIQWTIFDHDPATMADPPVAKNITGWTIQYKMSTTEGGVAGGSTGFTRSATLTTPASGICQVASLAADTSGLAAGTYHYTLSRTDSGSNQVLAWGTVALRGRPT